MTTLVAATTCAVPSLTLGDPIYRSCMVRKMV